MNLEEAIKHAEEIAEEQEGRGYCDRSVCVIMDENNHNCDECEVVKCRECAKEHIQLAEWIKELKAHREAWEKMQKEIEEYIDTYGNMASVKTVLYIVDKYRPKEGDGNDN